MIIKSNQYAEKRRDIIGIYDRSTKGVVLEYFTIVNKILNHHTRVSDYTIIEKKESTSLNSHISLRQIHSSFSRETYKEKSFLEKVSFFLSTARDAVRTASIDTSIESINAYKENLNKLNKLSKEYDELLKKLDDKQTTYASDRNEIKVDEAYEKKLNEHFKKYPEYKQAKDEFDRLENEKTQKIEQMNNLVLKLNNFRRYILNEFNPIVLELLDLLEENELNFKKEYIEISEKLHHKIDYSFKSTSSKEIKKTEKLLKWDELRNCIEILEKDNILLDNEIDKIIGNEFFKNYINNELRDFNTIKSKLNSLIKQNEIIITKLPKIVKDTELENLKKELKSLESKLQELVEQKTEYVNDIEEFNREYNFHLGEIIKDILNLKKEILYKKTIKQQKAKKKYQEDIQTFEDTKETIVELKSTISELEDALDSIDENDENYKELSEAYNELKEELEKLEDELELQEEELELTKEFIDDETIEQEYEEVKKHYEEFENEYEHIKESFYNLILLNEEEKKGIQSLCTRAIVLFHLYSVPDELKIDLVINSLKVKCSKKDIADVKNILDLFEKYLKYENSIENIKDIKLLEERIKKYKKDIETIKADIKDIHEDETYQSILEIEDRNNYFEELKNELEIEEIKLSNELKSLKIELGLVQTLTPHQNKVYTQTIEKIKNIFNHDNNDDDNIISISGSAGVGKTFLIIKIIEYLTENNIALVVTTPTHKALSVITDSLHKYDINNIETKTLHSFLQLKVDIDEKTGSKVFQIDEKNKEKNETGVLIIDESSMVGNDLFHFIKEYISQGKIKAVLFVGDPYQLPPVNSEENSIFELENLYSLKEIIRQQKDSYIISIATQIRDCIINQDFSLGIEDFFKDDFKGLKVFSNQDEFLNHFFTNDSEYWYSKNQIIADYTNKSVDRYNFIARERYWDDRGVLNPKQIEPNDIVVFQEAVLDGDKVVFHNGSITKVKKVSQEYDNKLDLSYWLCEDEKESKFKIINNIDQNKYQLLLESKIKEAKNATNGYEKKLKWVEYYKLKEQYASIKFNYSSTIHKLQGSTYETVFIDLRKMQNLYRYSKNIDKEFLYRLLYVAVTRASKDINILKNI